MRIAISSCYYADDFPKGLSLDQKIEVFGDRILGWQLIPAQELADKIPHSGFAVLHVVMSYFESIAKFRDGYIRTDRSKIFFKKGFTLVFPTIEQMLHKETVDNLLNAVYEQIRCGLYHASMTGAGIIVTGDIEQPILVSHNEKNEYFICINPHTITLPLRQHFFNYLIELRNPTNKGLRQNFERRFIWLESGQKQKDNVP